MGFGDCGAKRMVKKSVGSRLRPLRKGCCRFYVVEGGFASDPDGRRSVFSDSNVCVQNPPDLGHTTPSPLNWVVTEHLRRPVPWLSM